MLLLNVAAAAAKSLQSCQTVCDPTDGSPPGSLSPWDSPGKNTGVGCHFLLQCMKVKSESEIAQSCPTLRPHGLQPTRLLRPWDFPGKSTGVGCHCLLQHGEAKSTNYSLLFVYVCREHVPRIIKFPSSQGRMWGSGHPCLLVGAGLLLLLNGFDLLG